MLPFRRWRAEIAILNRRAAVGTAVVGDASRILPGVRKASARAASGEKSPIAAAKSAYLGDL